MSERYDFDVALQFQSEGSEAQMAELGRYVAALDRVIQAQEKFGGSTATLAQRSREAASAMSGLSKDFTSALGDVGAASKAYENLDAHLKEMANSYRLVQQEAARAGNTSFSPAYTQPANVTQWETRELKQYIDLMKAANANLSNDVREEFERRRAAVEGAVQAQARYNAVVAAGEDAARTAGMDRLTASTLRLAEARRELATAQAQIQQQEAASAYGTASADAYDRGRVALESYNAAVTENTSAVREQQDAYDLMAETVDELDFSKSITGMDKMDAATTKLSKSQKELDDALEQVRKEEQANGGQGTATAQAYDQVTAAAKTRISAEKELNGVLQSRQAAELNLRYGLYDVSRSAALVAGSLVAVGAGSVAAFASWESGMSNIYQTNMDKPVAELERIEGSLKDIAGEIPITLGELQNLVALAGQLEVSGDLADFAETMAMLGMISESISAEDAATRIAKLVNVLGGAEAVMNNMDLSAPEDAYRAIATAIAQVSVTAAANEQEILHTSANLARVAAQANFTADEVVGLATAFASMGMPAELSRSAMQDFVKTVNMGIAGVGDMPQKLQNMANMMGLTSEAAANLWQEDPAEFFLRFISAVDQAAQAGGNVTSILASVGLTSQRAAPAFAALAGNSDLVARSFQEAALGAGQYDDEMSTFAQRVGIIADDLVSMWQVLQNEFLKTAAVIGAELAPVLKDLITEVGTALEGFQEWLQTPAGATFLEWAVRIGGIVTALAGFVSVAAAAGASMIAFRWAMTKTPIGRFAMQMLGLTAATRGVGVAATGAAIGVSRLTLALRTMARASGWFLAIDLALRLLFDFKNTVYEAMSIMATGSMWLSNAVLEGVKILSATGQASANFVKNLVATVGTGVNAIINLYNAAMSRIGIPIRIPPLDVQGAIAGVQGFTDSAIGFLDGIGASARYNMGVWETTMRDLRQWAFGDSSKSRIDPTEALDWGQFDEMIDALENGIGDALENGLGNGAKKGANQAKKELRLLTDYASDLSGVMQRAFDIRFGSMLTKDSISSAFIDMAEAVEAARKKVRDLRIEMQSTAVSIGQLEYFLSVALDYGDTMRAAEIEAELAKLRAEQADKAKELADAQDEASLGLEGNSKAAIENRKTMTSLVSSYQDHLEALAASGMSQEDLLKESKRLKKEFIAQATGMGYNRREVMKYAAAFDDMAMIISAVPRNVTIEADGGPGLTALREFFAKADEMIGGGLDVPVNVGGAGGIDTPDFGSMFDPASGGGFDIPGYNFPDDAWVIPNPWKKAEKEAKKGGKNLVKAGKKESTSFANVWTATWSTIRRVLGAEVPRAGQEQGEGYGRNLTKAGKDGAETFGRNVSQQISTITPWMLGEGSRAGSRFGTGLVPTAAPAAKSFGSAFTKNLSSANSSINSAGRTAGYRFRDGMGATAGSGLGAKLAASIRSGQNSANNAAYSTGASAGRNAGNAFTTGLRNTLRGKSIGAMLGTGLFAAPAKSKGVGELRMMYTGGYTGRGGKYDPAGIVHRGEYVVPKHGVDQRTGLPRADYMNSLGRPHQGSKSSYASGGYVRGGNSGMMVVELSAADRKALSNKAPVFVQVGQERVARAANAANLGSAKRGSN